MNEQTEISEPTEEMGMVEFYAAGEEGWRSTCWPELGVIAASGAVGFTIYFGLENQTSNSEDTPQASSSAEATEASIVVKTQPTTFEEALPEALGGFGFLYLSLCSLFVMRSVRRSRARSEHFQRIAKETINAIQANTDPSIS